MKTDKRVWILALLAAVSLAFPASAADKKAAAPAAKAAPSAAKPTWEVVAIRKPTDGSFAFCRAERYYADSGLTLAIALSPAMEVNVGIKVPDAGFKKGEGYPLALKVEGTDWTKQATAEAALPELLLIRLGTDDKLMSALGKGTALSAKGDTDETRFTLAGASQMLDALKSCVNDGVKNKLPPMPQTQTGANGATLPEGLAALLKQAQLDVKPVKLAGDSEANAVDHAWTVTLDGATLDGGFRETRVKPAEDFKKLSAKTIDDLKAQCKQGLKVAPGPEEKFSQLTMQTYNLTCDKEFVALVAYRTSTDIYGILMHRGAATQAKQAQAARDRLATILRKIGAEGPPKQ